MRILACLNLHSYGDLAISIEDSIELSKQHDIVINESVDADIACAPIYRTELIANNEELLQNIQKLLNSSGIGHKIVNINAYTQKPNVTGLLVFAGGETVVLALKTLEAEIVYRRGTTWRGEPG